MVKDKETISLERSKQKRVSERIVKLKKKIQDGSVEISETKKENKQKAEENRGLIYVGHIPHGFYEDQMKDYFKQFGEVTNVTVCRSGKTGKSKGYGFVEFKNHEVAQIVAETMDNYIMFKKRLAVEYIPYKKRPKKLFCGKGNTEINYSARRRRLKQMVTKNKTLNDIEVFKKGQDTIKKLNKKVEKLRNVGVNCNLQPVNVTEKIKKEKSLPNLKSEDNSDDSELEFKVPKKQSKKQLAGKKSYTNLIDGHELLLKKSIDSVQTLISKSELRASRSENSKDALAVSTRKKGQKKRKTTSNSKGIKKKSKAATLNNETLRQIARELIRKRGTPMINLLPSHKKKSKA